MFGTNSIGFLFIPRKDKGKAIYCVRRLICLICKLQMEIKWEIKTYLFCSVLESDAEQREMLFYDAKTMWEKMV